VDAGTGEDGVESARGGSVVAADPGLAGQIPDRDGEPVGEAVPGGQYDLERVVEERMEMDPIHGWGRRGVVLQHQGEVK
jgi:hypothetical protein